MSLEEKIELFKIAHMNGLDISIGHKSSISIFRRDKLNKKITLSIFIPTTFDFNKAVKIITDELDKENLINKGKNER